MSEKWFVFGYEQSDGNFDLESGNSVYTHFHTSQKEALDCLLEHAEANDGKYNYVVRKLKLEEPATPEEEKKEGEEAKPEPQPEGGKQSEPETLPPEATKPGEKVDSKPEKVETKPGLETPTVVPPPAKKPLPASF